jgi:formate dehydrogenase subunit gamma
MTQPYSDETALDTVVSEVLALHAHRPGPLLIILQDIQKQWGYLPESVVPKLAQALNLTRAEIHGVISFYHDLRTQPGGQHRLQICRAEACQAQGGRALEAAAQAILGIGWHQTTADGSISLDPVYCLGNCATGPAVRIDDQIIGDVEADDLPNLIAQLKIEKLNISALINSEPSHD